MNALRRHLSTLPGLLKAGFVVLAVGLVTDAAYHVFHGGETSHHATSAAALFIHGVVGAGMALSLLGIAHAGLGRRTRPEAPEGRR